MLSAQDPTSKACIELKRNSRQAFINDNEVILTGLEFTLLALLMDKFPAVVTRDEIAQCVFSKEITQCNRCINSHISNLRHKLIIPDEHITIKAIRGRGYQLTSH